MWHDVPESFPDGLVKIQGIPQIKAVMTPFPYWVDMNAPVSRARAMMAEHHIDCALVVKDDRLAGIFTVTDGCRTFGQMLRSLFPKGGNDAA